MDKRHPQRLVRTHWAGGEQLLISAPEHLTPDDVKDAPPQLVELLKRWPAPLDTLPGGLRFVEGELRARRPLLERSRFDDRVYWSLRLPRHGDAAGVAAACFGSTHPRPDVALPQELGWLAQTFGRSDLCSEWSGSAPWGARLADVRERLFDDVVAHLPERAGRWAALYEVDGDWIFADLEDGTAHWVGAEWTGVPDVRFASWRRVLRFVLWRLLDGGFVRPMDLEMLGP